MSRLATLLAVAAAAGAFSGCTSIIGINPPIDKDGGAAATTPTGPPRAEVARFIGTWQSPNGVLTLSCPGFEPKKLETSGTLTVVQGTSSDLVATNNGGCALRSNVAGDTATVEPGQTCTTMPDGETDTYTFSSGSFVIGPAGKAGTVKLAGTVKAVTPDSTLDCTFEATDPYSKG